MLEEFSSPHLVFYASSRSSHPARAERSVRFAPMALVLFSPSPVAGAANAFAQQDNRWKNEYEKSSLEDGYIWKTQRGNVVRTNDIDKTAWTCSEK